ncbi:MAG: NupC/NupG family nucleoside CNT transporter [Planctomycetota bacterium]|jgi:CNT family concentrative nucleoside transporter
MERIISFCGLFVMLAVALGLSSARHRINLRLVGGGLVLQFVLALLILKTETGHQIFQWLGDRFRAMQTFTDAGTGLIFGIAQSDGPPDDQLLRTLAFGVLPTIIFFSALMSVLYHLGLIQIVVRALAKLMQFSLGTSGAETLAAASNVFVGQTEAPLVVKPYLRNMTESELMALMVGGFSTIAGGVLAVYVSFGVDAAHLMTASVISAPAALVVAKIMTPETGTPETAGQSIPNIPPTSNNLVEAATNGTSDGLKLALNVAAMLLAFTALVALADALIGWCGEQYVWLSGQSANTDGVPGPWSLSGLLGYVFAPFAWCLGIPREDLFAAGQLLGLKTVTNEFLAYQQMTGSEAPELSERSRVILTYALCGFANFASIGIQIGGIGALVPERRSDLARLSIKAMIGGTLACFMTACIAGVLLA